MKIGFVSTWFERGATHVTLAFIEALKPVHACCVYARGGDEFPHDNPQWAHDYVHWGEFVPGARNTFIDTRDFLAWLRRETPDVLLFNEQQSWDVLLWLHSPNFKEKYGIDRPIIGAYIDYYTDETVPFFALYDFLICNTRRHFSVFNDHPGAVYVPWAVATERFPFNTEVHQPVTFFHSLGYNPVRKGTDLVIEAFQRIGSDARLVLHAQRPLSDFPHLADAIGDHPHITWINREVSPPGLYHLGDVYVYPSRLDGIGLSLPEALASGLPALTTDEAPMNEFVSDEVNGFLIPVTEHRKRNDGYFWPMAECSVDALAGRMEALASNPDLVVKLKAATRADAQIRFNTHTFAKQLRQAFEQALQLGAPKTTSSQKLMDDCRAHERANTPPLKLRHRVHRVLIAWGARKVKRALFRRG